MDQPIKDAFDKVIFDGDVVRVGSSESESLVKLRQCMVEWTDKRLELQQSRIVLSGKRIEYYNLQCELTRLCIDEKIRDAKRDVERDARREKEREAQQEREIAVQKEIELVAQKEKERDARKSREKERAVRDAKEREPKKVKEKVVSLKVDRKGQLVPRRDARDKSAPASSAADK